MPITYIQGDLFSSQSPVLAHACNCQGAWGAGVAAIFRRKFPSAYSKYRNHCAENEAQRLLGTTYLAETDDGRYIACLFTSDKTGLQKLPPEEIVQYTKLAMDDLVVQMAALGLTQVAMPKINAGLFAVPWGDTEAVLETVALDITVYTLD